MATFEKAFFGIAAPIAAGVLAGCGAASGPVPGPAQAARPLARSAGCSSQVVYVTSYDNSVYVYDQSHNGKTPCGQITGVTNPQGLFVDKNHDLWVAVSGDCRTQFSSVLEFAPGGSTPIKTLQDPDGAATDVAVDDNSGTVYVTNFFNYTTGCASGNNGVVEVYKKGHSTPTKTLSDPNMTYAFDDAVDNQGNLYVTYLKVNGPTGTGRINEWTGGSGSPVDLGITLQAPGGIATTKSGALLVCDQGAACGEFLPGSTTMTKLFGTKHTGWFGVALNRRENDVWVENPSLGNNQLENFVFPGPRKKPRQSLTVPDGGYAGVAVSPAAPQGKPY